MFGRVRISKAEVANLRAPNDAAAQPWTHIERGILQIARCQWPMQRGRKCLQRDRGLIERFPESCRLKLLQTRRYRRCPSRYRSLPEIDPGRHRILPTHRDRYPRGLKRSFEKANPHGPKAA